MATIMIGAHPNRGRPGSGFTLCRYVINATIGTIENTRYGGSLRGLISKREETIIPTSSSERLSRCMGRGEITARVTNSRIATIANQKRAANGGATTIGWTKGFDVNNRSSIPRGAMFSVNVKYW